MQLFSSPVERKSQALEKDLVPVEETETPQALQELQPSDSLPIDGIIGWPKWLIVAFLGIAIGCALLISFLPDSFGNSRGGLRWLFGYKPIIISTPIEDVVKILAPFSALALMIERVIEIIFDLFEQSIQQVARLGSGTVKAFRWLNLELNKAWVDYQAALKDMWNEPPSEKKLDVLERAKDRIDRASKQLEGMKKDPKYVSTKRMLSIWLGLSLGLIVAVLSDEGLFEYLNISVPRFFDMAVTGLVIGSGSGPVHSLVGMLQNGKDAIQSLSKLWESSVPKNTGSMEGK